MRHKPAGAIAAGADHHERRRKLRFQSIPLDQESLEFIPNGPGKM
jgi:hypothetical protein